MSLETKNSRIIKVSFQQKTIVILPILIVLLFLFGGFFSKGFFTVRHTLIILRLSSFLGLVSIGQTIVILTGGIDLSVGALITMGNLFTCMFIKGLNENTFWVLIGMVSIGAFFGLINGFGISYLKISPLVMTLAVGSVITGITLIISQGEPRGFVSPILRLIGVGSILNYFPIMVLIWIILSLLTVCFLNFSVFGRKIYYIGSNEKAAYMSGIKTNKIKAIAYSISGVSAIFTGCLMAGYTETAFLGIGEPYIMWSITAVVIGGTSLQGGIGGYINTVAGAIIVVLLESLLVILNISEAGRGVANGIIILVLMGIHHHYGKKGEPTIIN